MLTLSIRGGAQLLLYIYGVHVTVFCTSTFQERISTLSYALLGKPNQLDAFTDTNFVVFVIRTFVIAVALIYWAENSFFVASTALVENLELWLIGSLSISVLCIYGLSIDNTVRSANDGSQLHFAIGIACCLLLCGYVLLRLSIAVQSDLKTKSSKFQMMAAMNCLNFVACLSIIYQQGTLLTSIEFILTHPIFAQDLLLLSIAELIGQMFIYQTVERFGFVMFGSSLVVRQIIAALFSNILEASTIQFTFAFGCAVFITHSIMKFRERKNVKLE